MVLMLSTFSSIRSIRSAIACSLCCKVGSWGSVSTSLLRFGRGESTGGGMGIADLVGGQNGVGGHLGIVHIGEVAGTTGLKADDKNSLFLHFVIPVTDPSDALSYSAVFLVQLYSRCCVFIMT